MYTPLLKAVTFQQIIYLGKSLLLCGCRGLSRRRYSPSFNTPPKWAWRRCQRRVWTSLHWEFACEERGLSYQPCGSLSAALAAICFFTLQVLYPTAAVFLWVILPIPPQESRPPLLLPILGFPPGSPGRSAFNIVAAFLIIPGRLDLIVFFIVSLLRVYFLILFKTHSNESVFFNLILWWRTNGTT